MEERLKQLEQHNRELELIIQAQAALIEKLRAQLEQNSKNSHHPPSSDPPKTRAQRRRRKRSDKTPGGQLGHQGHQRELVEQDQVDVHHVLIPHACEHCHSPLHGHDPKPQRHQVWELPPPQIQVHQFELHRLVCSACTKTTRAKLPDGFTLSQFGPRIHALHAWLRLDMRASRARVQTFFADVLGLRISLGALSAMDKRVSQQLKPSYEQLQQAIQSSELKHCDETTWYQDGQRRVLWTATDGKVALLRITSHRDTLSLKALIGDEVQGVVISDRYSAYRFIKQTQRQLCWAHLLRDFESMSEQEGSLGSWGMQLHLFSQMLLRDWSHHQNASQKQWDTFSSSVLRRRHFVLAVLEDIATLDNRWGGMAREMLKEEHSMWTFLRKRGIPPTNNLAERTLRHAVMWRKSSYGSRSDGGLRFVERGLSVRQTLLNQGRSFFEGLFQLLSTSQFQLLSP